MPRFHMPTSFIRNDGKKNGGARLGRRRRRGQSKRRLGSPALTSPQEERVLQRQEIPQSTGRSAVGSVLPEKRIARLGGLDHRPAYRRRTRPMIRLMANRIRNRKNRICATPELADAIPPNPSAPAISAMTKKTRAQ